jgi:hypothetical protein
MTAVWPGVNENFAVGPEGIVKLAIGRKTCGREAGTIEGVSSPAQNDDPTIGLKEHRLCGAVGRPEVDGGNAVAAAEARIE